jgi:hypothetical protein
MNQITIPEEKVANMKAYVEKVTHAVNTLEITDETSLEQAINAGSGIKKALNKLEADRKIWVKPLNDQVKALNTTFKYYTEPLKELEKKVKAKMIVYHTEQREKQEAERRRVEAERQKKLAELEAQKKKEQDEVKKQEIEKQQEETANMPDMTEAPPKTTRSEHGKSTVKERWNFEVLDKNKVPEQYKIVDEKAVRQAIRDGEREIVGIRIFKNLNISL